MDYRYARPQPHTPSSMAEPFIHHQPPPRQPVPAPGPWFPGQFQYHPSHNSDHLPPPPYHAPSPPPPPPYHAPPPPHHNQYHIPPPPPRPHLAPPLPPQIPQSYPPPNQDWSNAHGNHQHWDFSGHTNEDDWAAKARAWAAAKAVTDSQDQHLHFASVGRPEELNIHPDQYSRHMDSHYLDPQHQHMFPASNYQQFQPSVSSAHNAGHLRESSPFNSGFVPDGPSTYAARDPMVAYNHQESSPANVSVHPQEVPFSYSSVAGQVEVEEQNEKFYQTSHVPFGSAPQPPFPAGGSSVLMEQRYHAFGNQSVEPTIDLSDQPLEFAPRFGRDHDSLVQTNYTDESLTPLRAVDAAGAKPSSNAWTSPPAPGVVFPPGPPVQVDPSAAVPPPVPPHSAPLFGRMAAPSFQPTLSSANASFPIGNGDVFRATTPFPGDTFGPSGISERPKKASVPNWLREEIIKKKFVIGSSAAELSKADTKVDEDEYFDGLSRKGDQADNKSVDSPRPIDEEDDDEDYVEAARTAAINQEIKRVLTEVLLKVTDELFDEIATKVLSEDELSVEVASNNPMPPSTPVVPSPKASAKVPVPATAEVTDSVEVREKPISSSPSDILGLANYASDDDDDGDEIRNSAQPSSKSEVHQQLGSKKLLDEIHPIQNGSSGSNSGERINSASFAESDSQRISSNRGAAKNSDPQYSFQGRYTSAEGETNDSDGKKVSTVHGTSQLKDSAVEKDGSGTELPAETLSAKKLVTDDTSKCENRSSGSSDKELNSSKDRILRKEDENSKSQDERNIKRERKEDRDGLKKDFKEQGALEKVRDCDSRGRLSPADSKDRKETDRDRRVNAKEDNDRRKERIKDEKEERAKDEKGEREKDEKETRPRHKLPGDNSSRKRHCSSSNGSRGRNLKDNSTVSHARDSSDGSSDDLRRKVHSKQRNSSPSPVRSRRRQVSRSPHSKSSQRRHSPYSSLENTRAKRSRSRSPARRKR